MKNLIEYPFTVRPLSGAEGGGYLVEFPDLPGCIADGETPEEAISAARDALKSYLLTAKEFGDKLPSPNRRGPGFSGQWRQRVPRSMHARLSAQAQREGVSLNTLVTSILAEGMGKRRRASS